jgi:hypothetical protein
MRKKGRNQMAAKYGPAKYIDVNVSWCVEMTIFIRDIFVLWKRVIITWFPSRRKTPTSSRDRGTTLLKKRNIREQADSIQSNIVKLFGWQFFYHCSAAGP